MKKYRNEWKYEINKYQFNELLFRLNAVLEKDEHASEDGSYTVRSVYFDDLNNTSATDTDAGVNRRFKYRIRAYGNDDIFYLEKKEKLNGLCHKKSIKIDKDVCLDLISGNYDGYLYSENELLKHFVTDAKKCGIYPKVIVEYKRFAFVEKIHNIRITLDTNICVSKNFDGFFTLDYFRVPIQEKDMNVLEVKFDEILPSYIKRAIFIDHMVQQSFSKYHIGYHSLKKY